MVFMHNNKYLSFFLKGFKTAELVINHEHIIITCDCMCNSAKICELRRCSRSIEIIFETDIVSSLKIKLCDQIYKRALNNFLFI